MAVVEVYYERTDAAILTIHDELSKNDTFARYSEDGYSRGHVSEYLNHLPIEFQPSLTLHWTGLEYGDQIHQRPNVWR